MRGQKDEKPLLGIISMTQEEGRSKKAQGQNRKDIKRTQYTKSQKTGASSARSLALVDTTIVFFLYIISIEIKKREGNFMGTPSFT